ncbi:hypothetical protein CAPTEDRAFT_141594 [Capitella teleta]|uniref:Sulfotransferase domain-containing protein n=1 Tax=Capitella teleta TaxID=283909 RepID=R7TU59_CAPTE|nr:hypothetical protein CAPTEDRAFT_141595 [Capitella teleta]ELT94996.1 hypothetical protein CAPTEDRAFT_141594 [Capitella teleta]|eukprot:ELT94994.1 hypothetical protein CAPTEDRAFT_141595 [Capitella teleta]
MTQDWEVAKYLQKRIKIVRYEDLARDPAGIAVDIYRFLGVEMPQRVLKWISRNTAGGALDRSMFSTTRNSSAVAERWKQNLPHEHKLSSTKICKNTLIMLGYSLDI